VHTVAVNVSLEAHNTVSFLTYRCYKHCWGRIQEPRNRGQSHYWRSYRKASDSWNSVVRED